MEAKELMDFLGIEAENIDEFKGKFSGKYFTEKQVHASPEMISKFTGKTLGQIKHNILKAAREAEIPVTNNEFDESPIEDVFKTIYERTSQKYGTQIEELKGQIGKTGEEAIKPWQEKVQKYEQSLADEKRAKKEIADQFENFKKESEGQIKSTRINYFKKDLLTSIDYAPGIDDLKRKGWESHIAEHFRFDFDENDSPIITDKDGNKIKNPKKADEWLSPKDVLTQEADKLGLLKKNPQGGRPAFQPPVSQPTQQPGQQQTPPMNPTKRNRLAPGMEKYL